MGCRDAVVAKLRDVLPAAGHEAMERDGNLFLPRWGVSVSVAEGDIQERNGRVAIYPTISAIHPYFRNGFARELGVALGGSVEDAVGKLVASWMLLFFPLMKFLFDPHPHDCTVHEEAVEVPAAGGRGYRLIAGPVQTTGLGTDGLEIPEGMNQSLLWNAFSDLVIPGVSRGVHHVRCYVGRFVDGVRADVFVNGEECEEASARLAQLAKEFPEPDERHPIMAMKQHLLLRPADLEADLGEEMGETVAGWRAAVGDRVEGTDATMVGYVLRALFVMSRYWGGEREAALVREGVPGDVAARLVSFMESAAARVVLGDRVEYSPTYYWANRQTGRAVERRYDQTPEFVAARQVMRALREAGLAQKEVGAVASGSAEVGLVEQAIAQTGKFSGGTIAAMMHGTSEAVEGEDLDVVMARMKGGGGKPKEEKQAKGAKRPWWKVW